MADDAHEERLRQHEEMLQGLARVWHEQHAMNQRVEGVIEEQREFNRQQVTMNQQQRDFNADVRTTLARIETLLARMIPTGENGREA